jgi:hypothetical protein
LGHALDEGGAPIGKPGDIPIVCGDDRRLAEPVRPAGAEDIQPLVAMTGTKRVSPEEADVSIGRHEKRRLGATLTGADRPIGVRRWLIPILTEPREAAGGGPELVVEEICADDHGDEEN